MESPTEDSPPAVQEIYTEHLGWSALGLRRGGSTRKLQLIPSPWPTDNLPPHCASLLAVASKNGLVAAAGPDTLIVASTDATRKAFEGEADQTTGIVTDFTPDFTIPVPQLRHIAFSSGEDFLVISAESNGGLVVYHAQDLAQKKEPIRQMNTNNVALRALVPNPVPSQEQYFAVVSDSGALFIADVENNQMPEIRPDNVTCAAWSVKGKALVAGLTDGTAIQYMPSGKQRDIIPRPPNVEDGYAVAAIYWLTQTEFFIAHCSSEPEQDVIYHFVSSVKTEKGGSSWDFLRCDERCFSAIGAPTRSMPLRRSITRLRDWKPDLDDLLILTASNSAEMPMFTKASANIASDVEVTNEYAGTSFLDDSRQATLPLGADGNDSVPVGEALDLSSKERVQRPIPTDEEIEESPTPLPAFLALNHLGVLSAWWIMYDKSIRAGTGYPGLVALREDTEPAKSVVTAPPVAPASSPPASATPITSRPSSTQTSTLFGISKQPTPTFGAPSSPAFGTSSLPGHSMTTGFGKPSVPVAFGAPTAIGKPGAGFGTTGAPGSNPSPWGQRPTSSAQNTPNPFSAPSGAASPFSQITPTSNPFSKDAGAPSGFATLGGGKTPSTTTSNPFSKDAGAPSGFATLGGGKTSSTTTPLSSFNSVNSTSSLFGNTGQQQPADFSFGGNKQQSFQSQTGSTLSIASGPGSTIPSWGNTPSQQGGSIFGKENSSFNSTTSTNESDMSDATQDRGRDEATPTPQAPQSQATSNGFKHFQLGSTFKGDGSAKDDLPKPPASASNSMFGDLATQLPGSSSKPPATPIKQEKQETRLQDISTTPATLPKPPATLFPTTTPAKAPPAQRETPIIEDAPLPPDPMTWKPPKPADEEYPSLAGSPGVEVEAPESSDVSSSSLDDDEGDGLEVEEQDSNDEVQEPSPSDAARKSRTPKPRFGFQDSDLRPPAPTPPARTTSPAGPPGHGQLPHGQIPKPPGFSLLNSTSMQSTTPKPLGTSRFNLNSTQSNTPGGFPKPPSLFPPPPTQKQDKFRPPSPVRVPSLSTNGTRPQMPNAPRSSSRGSVQQQPKPPTPQPQPQVEDLSDEEDERIRQELAKDVVPKRTLDEFVAHQDYAGSSQGKSGHAAQIEIMYRDINGMVDTLGLNSRSLGAFIKYHSNARPTKLTRHDFEDVEEDGTWYDEWYLSEINDLADFETELDEDLDEGRVQNVVEKLAQLARLLNEKAKLMTKINDIRRQIITRKDPEKAEALRKASLPKELADRQKTLRAEYARLLSQLGHTEDALMFLRSKLASRNAENGKTGAVPTVDAIKKTINRLIQVTEKKHSEIVLLESQMRKVGLAEGSRPTSSSSRNFGTPSRSSRALRGQSPFATPPTNKNTKMSLSELNRKMMTPEVEDTTPSRGFGLYYTPEGSPTPGDSLVALANKIDDDALVGLREIAARRKKLARGLTSAILKRDVKVTSIE